MQSISHTHQIENPLGLDAKETSYQMFFLNTDSYIICMWKSVALNTCTNIYKYKQIHLFVHLFSKTLGKYFNTRITSTKALGLP